MPKIIKIIRTPAGDIQPEGGVTTRHRPGEVVKFMTDPSAQGVTLTFTGASPFGPDKTTIGYGVDHTVTAAFNASDPNGNLYPYMCTLSINGQTFVGKPGKHNGGGEMEVIRGGE
jgi:hypothetical protein